MAAPGRHTATSGRFVCNASQIAECSYKMHRKFAFPPASIEPSPMNTATPAVDSYQPTAAALDLTPLQLHVAREILAYARRQDLKAGEHVSESQIASQIGTSRSPVNVALRHLVELGVVAHDLNRGFFLRRDAISFGDIARQIAKVPDDPLYLQVAEDRLSGRLPETVTEADLMRAYGASRAAVRKVLSRIQQEGWVEKAIGHGWRFQPMIDSLEAYEESYVYRASIEPAGLLGAGFQPNATELQSLRRQQELIVGGGYQAMTPIELFESNSVFHETLARWSGNRFILQGVRRTNQLRRLIEYRQAVRERAQRKDAAEEHLAVLAAITKGDLLQAASLMRAHLETARRVKVHNADIFEPKGLIGRL